MAKNKAVAAVRYFEERLKERKVSISKIILFGSRRGEVRPQRAMWISFLSPEILPEKIFTSDWR